MSDLKEKIKAAQIDLIKELGIDKLDQEQKEKLIMDIGQILQERIALRVTEELPEEKIEEFKTILDKAETDPAQLDQFLKENIPGIEDLILEEIGEYKKSALDFVNQALGKDASPEEGQPEKQEEEIRPEEEKQPVEQSEEKTEPVEVEQPAPVEQLEKQEFQEVVEAEKLPEQVEVAEEPQKEIEAPLPVEKLKEPLEIIEKVENFEEEKAEPEMKIEPSGIEQERIDQEAQIVEENKIENNQIASEELDLSNELEKMDDQEVSDEERE